MERYEVKSTELHLAFDPEQEGLTTVYLASEVDARHAAWENVLRQARGYLTNAAKARTHWEGCSHPECVILREIDSLMER